MKHEAREALGLQRLQMTPLQRREHRQFWLAWAKKAQIDLGALLAETIDQVPATSDTVYECVNKLIDVEQQLSAVLGLDLDLDLETKIQPKEPK